MTTQQITPMETSSASTEVPEVDKYSSPPPVGVVVVRGTPESESTAAASRNSPSDATPRSVDGRAPSNSFSSAFRLQPRGCGNIILPRPSPAHNPTSGGLFSESTSSGGRKRGANCLASDYLSSSGITGRALFPSKTVATMVVAAESSSYSTASHSSPAPWSPEESTNGILMAAASPGRVGNALQSLSLKSPIGTSQDRQLCWKGRETSPFHLYASPPPRSAIPDCSFLHGRVRGDSIGSVASASSARTPGSASRFSPRQVPILVIQNDGQEKRNTLSPLYPHGSSYVVSLDNKRQILQSPIQARTPLLHSTPDVVKMQVGTPKSHHCTPRMHDTTPRKQRTPSSRMTGSPSPHRTPLPRIKLTPRRTGGNDPSMAASVKLSPQDLDLFMSPVGAGVLDPAGGPLCSDFSSSKLPSPPRRNATSNMRTSSSYVRRAIFCVSPRKSTDKEKNSFGEMPAVVIRSLLAPCDSHPSPSLQAIVTSEAEAAALDCDGSLTDDDDDCEPFVLTDPATLAAERHESSDEGRRPSRRRRTSMEKDENHEVSAVNELLGSSLASPVAKPALSVDHASSSSSLIGMAFLRGDSMNSFGNSRSQRQWVYNCKLDSSGSSESGDSSTGDMPKVSDDDEAMNRVRSEENLNSIGLDLEASNWDAKGRGDPEYIPPQIAQRDLHTPPAVQNEPAAESLQRLGRCLRYRSSEKVFGRERGGPACVYLSRSDPGNVHRTIASLVAQELQQSPPSVCKS